uniref:Cobalamin biosynthesis protein CobD n=1 Tax=Chlorobium chlorochromatii (strain CaD3) TaxID=340177 RepID=Q3ASJ9_CHLCH
MITYHFMQSELLLLVAFVLDLLIGDPRWLPHPVQGIGWFALQVERWLRRTPLPLRLAGVVAMLLVVGGTATLAFFSITLATMFHPIAGVAVSLYLLYSSFAVKDLGDHAEAVRQPLAAGNIEAARHRVSYMVGRDTAALTAEGIALAATESVAENSVDGVTAPLFYAILFGPIGAITYKAINTLDSTFGYKNERYLEFGWASARLDDFANYLPARLTVLAVALAAALSRLRVADVFRAVREGAHLHASPNAGYPECACAGALGVTFGGARSYGGEVHNAPLLGIRAATCTPQTIKQCIRLMRLTAFIFLLVGIGVKMVIAG